MPDQYNLRVFNFEVKLHHGREATIQESGAAAHLGSTFRKQREMNASAQLTFLSLCSPGCNPGKDASHRQCWSFSLDQS